MRYCSCDRYIVGNKCQGGLQINNNTCLLGDYPHSHKKTYPINDLKMITYYFFLTYTLDFIVNIIYLYQ